MNFMQYQLIVHWLMFVGLAYFVWQVERHGIRLGQSRRALADYDMGHADGMRRGHIEGERSGYARGVRDHGVRDEKGRFRSPHKSIPSA
jgi:hypothetical protein